MFKKVALIVLSVLVVVGLIVGGFYLFKGSKKSATPTPTFGGNDTTQVEEVVENPEKGDEAAEPLQWKPIQKSEVKKVDSLWPPDQMGLVPPEFNPREKPYLGVYGFRVPLDSRINAYRTAAISLVSSTLKEYQDAWDYMDSKGWHSTPVTKDNVDQYVTDVKEAYKASVPSVVDNYANAVKSGDDEEKNYVAKQMCALAPYIDEKGCVCGTTVKPDANGKWHVDFRSVGFAESMLDDNLQGDYDSLQAARTIYVKSGGKWKGIAGGVQFDIKMPQDPQTAGWTIVGGTIYKHKVLSYKNDIKEFKH